MKKAYVNAYVRQNLGDDMFVQMLVRRYPGVRFYAQVEKPYQRAFLGEPNLILEDSPKGAGLKDRLAHRFWYDAFIKIGGSIFMEPRDWEQKPPFPAWQGALLNSNKFIVGANFGPYYTEAFLERARSSLRFYRGICFRDEYSFGLFRELEQARCAPDVLFGYPGYPEGKPGEGVGISVIAMDQKLPGNQAARSYYDTIAGVCDLLADRGIPVKLFSFCETEGDGEAIRTVLSRMKGPERVEAYAYDGDVGAMLEKLNDCAYIMASRFHGMVLGFMMGKTVYPMIYSEKQTHVIRDIGFDGQVWNVLDGAELTPEEILEGCMGNPKLPCAESLRRQAEGQFMFLDAYLGKN